MTAYYHYRLSYNVLLLIVWYFDSYFETCAHAATERTECTIEHTDEDDAVAIKGKRECWFKKNQSNGET